MSRRSTRAAATIAKVRLSGSAPPIVTPPSSPLHASRTGYQKSAGAVHAADDKIGLSSTGTRRTRKVSSSVKTEHDSSDDDQKPQLSTPPPTVPSRKKSKTTAESPSISPTKTSQASLSKKLLQLATYRQTPFPKYMRPTPEECLLVHDLLGSAHGIPKRPETIKDRPQDGAGCGQCPDVLDALVRTILSQNTSNRNSTAAKQAMDQQYGRGNYRTVLNAPLSLLQETIKCGGLANIKGRVIMKVLQSVETRQEQQIKSEGGEKDNFQAKKEGRLSLDYLHSMSDLEAMTELVSFDGVGPKTASCVLLFCLGRSSFAVDTHVFRLTSQLGWVPPNNSKVNRETAFQHLDVRIPDDLKYGLHSLLVQHGRSCIKCSANGVTSCPKDKVITKCPLDGVIKRSLKVGKEAGSVTPKKRKAGASVGKNPKKRNSAHEEQTEESELSDEEDTKDLTESRDGKDSKPTLKRSPSPKKIKTEESIVAPITPTTSRHRAVRSKIIKEELKPEKVYNEMEVEASAKWEDSAEVQHMSGYHHGL